MNYFLVAAAGLHALFMGAELFPWGQPLLLQAVSKKLPSDAQFNHQQRELVATIVHNAAIYNGIVCGGLLWAAVNGSQGHDVARVMLLGAVAAGIFGTLTLKSLVTAVQAVVGIAGWFFI